MSPTYRNNLVYGVSGYSGLPITVGSTRVEPGETKATDETIDPLPFGLSKVSDAPYAGNANIVSESYTGNDTESDTITVPVGDFSLDLDVYCSVGRVDVFFNSVSNTPATSLIGGDGFKQMIDSTTVRSVILVYKANATIVDFTLA